MLLRVFHPQWEGDLQGRLLPCFGDIQGDSQHDPADVDAGQSRQVQHMKSKYGSFAILLLLSTSL